RGGARTSDEPVASAHSHAGVRAPRAPPLLGALSPSGDAPVRARNATAHDRRRAGTPVMGQVLAQRADVSTNGNPNADADVHGARCDDLPRAVDRARLEYGRVTRRMEVKGACTDRLYFAQVREDP